MYHTYQTMHLEVFAYPNEYRMNTTCYLLEAISTYILALKYWCEDVKRTRMET